MFRLLILLCVLCVLCGSAFAERPPNIIFILADDLGYGDLGCYGQPRIKTPHLDRMAAEGMRFTNAYAGFNVCAPSRSVLMTGQHTGHTRVRSNGSGPLQPEDITVAELAKDAGYATALIGKWGLGEEDTTGAPWRQGFDHFFGYLNQGHAHNFYPEFLFRNDKKVKLRNVVVRSEKYTGMSGVATLRVDYSHDLFATEALEWIDANKDDPFFLYLAFTIPHANNQAQSDPGWKVIPEQLAYHRERQGMEVPDAGEYQETDWPGPQKGTAAMISRLDRDVGRIFEKLQARGIDENTIVFFSSDNGPHKEGGNDPYFFQSMGPLQGYKRSWHDGGIRVPMIARWPGKIEAGSVSDTVWYFADFLPTAAALMKIPFKQEGFTSAVGASNASAAPHSSVTPVDGVNILPTLLGEEQEELSERFLYWGYAGNNPGEVKDGAVRVGDWKAVIGKKGLALYDLKTDIAEANDIAAANTEIVEKIRAFLHTAVVPAEK